MKTYMDWTKIDVEVNTFIVVRLVGLRRREELHLTDFEASLGLLPVNDGTYSTS
jgi:hypothetical protein